MNECDMYGGACDCLPDIEIDEKEHHAKVIVAEDQLSLAIGKGGQNVRLAAKLTGWKIDIEGTEGETVAASDGEAVEVDEPKTGDSDEEIEQKVEEQEIADEIVGETTHETARVESEDTEATTPEEIEAEEADVEKEEGADDDTEPAKAA